MAYSREIYEKALKEIEKRHASAQNISLMHKEELLKKSPEYREIAAELGNISSQIIAAMSLPADRRQKMLKEIQKRNEDLIKAQKDLLRVLKLPEDYLDAKYTCEKCKDTGFVEEESEGDISHGKRLCSCHTELLKKFAYSEMAKKTPLELSSFSDFDLSYYKDGKADYKHMKYVYDSSVSYAANFDLDSVSLYFYGRTGLGKTHLSLAIANEVIKKGFSVVYGSVISFFNQLEREKFGRDNTDSNTMELLSGADLLILDDLGAEFTTALTTSNLYEIIDNRIQRGLPTIINSNLSPSDLKDRYPESIVSRIIGTFNVIEFSGADIRQKLNNE